jgi:hypothetical protein
MLGIALWLGCSGLATNWAAGLAREAAPPQMQMGRLPPPPSTPPPNRTRSGGSLSDATACTSSLENLLAIVPTKNPVLTISAHPTLLFYVPYAAKDVQVGEFSVLVGPNEMTRLYRARFTLPNSPGIVSVKLPVTSALTEGSFYHWYFKLYCTGNTTAKADLQVDGWVQRVEATPERERQIQAQTPEIWYDALAQLADQLSATPQDAQLRERWRSLLAFVGMTELTQTPIVGEVIIEP